MLLNFEKEFVTPNYLCLYIYLKNTYLLYPLLLTGRYPDKIPSSRKLPAETVMISGTAENVRENSSHPSGLETTTLTGVSVEDDILILKSLCAGLGNTNGCSSNSESTASFAGSVVNCFVSLNADFSRLHPHKVIEGSIGKVWMGAIP
jgi:hypothetical protein